MPPTLTSELQPRREGGIRCSVLFGDFVDLRLADCMDVMREYPDKHFDLAIADPPYGLGQDGHAGSVRVSDGKQLRRVFEQKEWDKQIPPAEYFVELRRVSKNQIVWGGNYMTAHLPPSRCWVTWDKVQRDLCMADGESAWTSFDEPSRIWTRHRKVLWDEKPIHPTQKPVKLYKWLLMKYAQPGWRILDTHLGSGSSAIAALDMKYELLGCEISEQYFATAVERIGRYESQGTFDMTPNSALCVGGG